MPGTLSPATKLTPSRNTAAVGTRSRARLVVKAALLAGAVVFVAECLRVFAGNNFHDVVPDKCFRSAQPSPGLLEDLQRTHGIRSVVNLRDENLNQNWYNNELATCRRLNIRLINAGLCSGEQPPDHDFHRFVQAIKDAPEPVLIHCANGNDRTGLASAVYLLMRTDTPFRTARAQLGLRYGHFAMGKALALHRILNSYEAWLQETGKEHHPDHFYYWGMNCYRQELLE